MNKTKLPLEERKLFTSATSRSTRAQKKPPTKAQKRVERRLADFNTIPKGGVPGYFFRKPGSQNRNKSAPAKKHR